MSIRFWNVVLSCQDKHGIQDSFDKSAFNSRANADMCMCETPEPTDKSMNLTDDDEKDKIKLDIDKVLCKIKHKKQKNL